MERVSRVRWCAAIMQRQQLVNIIIIIMIMQIKITQSPPSSKSVAVCIRIGCK